MTLHRTIVFVLIIAVVLLLAACDGINLDATTRTEPTPPSGVWQVESDQHARRIEERDAR